MLVEDAAGTGGTAISTAPAGATGAGGTTVSTVSGYDRGAVTLGSGSGKPCSTGAAYATFSTVTAGTPVASVAGGTG